MISMGNSIGKLLRFTATLVAIPVVASGCGGTRELYSEAGKTFADAYGAAVTAIDQEIENVTNSRRWLLASDYFKERPKNDKRAFAEFACAGAGVALDVRRELAVLNAYRDTIASLAEPLPEEIGGLIKSLATVPKPLQRTGPEESESPASLVSPAKVEELAFRVCTIYIALNVPPTSKGVIPPKTIKPVFEFRMLLQDVKKSYTFFREVIVLILKSADDVARVSKLRTYVKENQEKIEGVLKNIQDNRSLWLAFETRKRASLVEPYYRFKEMLQIPSTEADKKIAAVRKTILSLTEFDQLREVETLPDVVGAMSKAQNLLENIADETFDPNDFEDILQRLQTINERLRAVLNVFETAADKS